MKQFPFPLIKPRAQNLHRFGAVLMLRSFILLDDDKPRRDVRDANGAVRRVNALPARP